MNISIFLKDKCDRQNIAPTYADVLISTIRYRIFANVIKVTDIEMETLFWINWLGPITGGFKIKECLLTEVQQKKKGEI